MAMAALRAFWNSPVGPKTTHFWGPVANGGLVVAAIMAHMKKPAETIHFWKHDHRYLQNQNTDPAED